MATRQLVRAIARQRVAVFNTCQRSLHTSFVRFETPKTNFAEAITDKFIGQVKRQGKNPKGPEPTRFVQIDTLPITATTEDVLKLAREAFPSGDKSVVESKRIIYAFFLIVIELEIFYIAVFCRNLEFDFRGRCVVLMSSAEDARRLVEYGNRRSVGGNTVKMGYVSDTTNILIRTNKKDLTKPFTRLVAMTLTLTLF